jgi:hypothetical protein
MQDVIEVLKKGCVTSIAENGEKWGGSPENEDDSRSEVRHEVPDPKHELCHSSRPNDMRIIATSLMFFTNLAFRPGRYGHKPTNTRLEPQKR